MPGQIIRTQRLQTRPDHGNGALSRTIQKHHRPPLRFSAPGHVHGQPQIAKPLKTATAHFIIAQGGEKVSRSGQSGHLNRGHRAPAADFLPKIRSGKNLACLGQFGHVDKRNPLQVADDREQNLLFDQLETLIEAQALRSHSLKNHSGGSVHALHFLSLL